MNASRTRTALAGGVCLPILLRTDIWVCSVRAVSSFATWLQPVSLYGCFLQHRSHAFLLLQSEFLSLRRQILLTGDVFFLFCPSTGIAEGSIPAASPVQIPVAVVPASMLSEDETPESPCDGAQILGPQSDISDVTPAAVGLCDVPEQGLPAVRWWSGAFDPSRWLESFFRSFLLLQLLAFLRVMASTMPLVKAGHHTNRGICISRRALRGAPLALAIAAALPFAAAQPHLPGVPPVAAVALRHAAAAPGNEPPDLWEGDLEENDAWFAQPAVPELACAINDRISGHTPFQIRMRRSLIFLTLLMRVFVRIAQKRALWRLCRSHTAMRQSSLWP